MRCLEEKCSGKIVCLPPKCYYDLIDDCSISPSPLSARCNQYLDDPECDLYNAVLIFLPIQISGEPWRLMVSFHPEKMKYFELSHKYSEEYAEFLDEKNQKDLIAHIVFDFTVEHDECTRKGNEHTKFEELFKKMNALLECKKKKINAEDFSEEKILKDKSYRTLMKPYVSKGKSCSVSIVYEEFCFHYLSLSLSLSLYQV